MADQSLGKDDCLDDSDEGVYEQGDGPTLIEDETLTPIQRVTKYAGSENVYNRQCVSNVILELLQMASAEALTTDLPQMMEILNKLVNNDDVMIRMDVLEHIPNLAAIAIKQAQRVPSLTNITSEYLLSMVVNNLGDSDNQVRKNAHRALFTLLEKNLVNWPQVEIQVCPTILALSRKEPMSTDGVILMAKIVPLVGRDVTERVFLDRFAELCSDSKFYVRKSCASHIGDFCAIISRPLFEKVLFVAYSKLCNDEAWGVRKACADVAMSVSCACSPELRRNELSPAFARLLRDKCRWVRISAFQTLGPFISTFAEPTITSLAYNNMGELVLVSYGSEFKINNSSCTPIDEVKNLFYLCLDDFDYADYDDDFAKKNTEENELPEEPPRVIPTLSDFNIRCSDEELIQLLGYEESGLATRDRLREKENHVIEASDKNCDNLSSKISTTSSQLINVAAISASTDNTDHLENIDLSHSEQATCSYDSNCADSGGMNAMPEGNNEESLELYNSHNYWYVPPDMPLDPNIVAGIEIENEKTASFDKRSKYSKCEQSRMVLNGLEYNDNENSDAFCKNDFETIENSKLNETVVITPSAADTTFDADEQPDVTLKGGSSEMTELKEPPQKIVPQLLIDHFISMADPSIAQNIDDNIAYHCAYSLPAVALTLGSNNSHLLKETVETLSNNMQYKVRHTLASSLHELALIWGPEVASNDLTPIFNDLIKDLDEVRIGVLKNLAHFLRLINPSKRSLYLPRLTFFLQNNQKLNWRFRHELAEQLLLAVTMFTPAEASKHISLIAQRLLCDKVAAVRQIALRLVAQLLRHISTESGLSSRLLIKFAETFAHSKKWKLRQTFVFLSAELLISKALPIDQFACDVMPHLLDLSWDPVANVRLVVARTVATHIINNEYFHDPENQHYDTLESVLRRLQTDKDTDVRQSAMIDSCPMSANVY